MSTPSPSRKSGRGTTAHAIQLPSRPSGRGWGWVFLLRCSSPAYAGDEIIVTGRGLDDAAGDVAYSIATVERERLTATASGRLEDALKDVAGLQQFRRSDARSANPTSQGATLRGLGGNAASRVLVLLDGVPQGDPFAGYINWPLYLPERIGRVRVTRGGGSGAGGSGALAGTIELDSVGAVDAPARAGSLSGGSFEAVEGRALISGRLGGGFGLVSGGYAQGDGFVPVVTPGPADRGARYAQGSFAARAVIPAAGGELQAAIDLSDDVRTRGTDFSRNSTTGADASLRYVARDLLLLGYVQLRRFTSQFASVDAARSQATQTLDQFNTPATGLGLKAEVRPRIGATELRIGAEWRQTSGETNEGFSFLNGAATRLREAGGQSDIVGGFVEATHKLGPVTLTGGGRLDRWSLTKGFLRERRVGGAPLSDTSFAARSGWEWTARGGAAFDVTPGLALRGAGYIGWRLPTLNELYRPFRVGTEVTGPNAALVPERSEGGELGLSWRPTSGLRIDAAAFAVRLRDAIANVTLSQTPAGIMRERRNLDALDVRGVEADMRWHSGDWRVAASAAFTDSRISASGLAAPLNDLRPASVAPFQASGTLGWRGLSTTLRYISAQWDDDQNTRRLAPALTLDAIADAPLGGGIAVRARIENALDTEVQAARSAAGVIERASPRAFWIGLRVEK